MPRTPMLDPQRDLAGATPETLALALLGRSEPLRPRLERAKEERKEDVREKSEHPGLVNVE